MIKKNIKIIVSIVDLVYFFNDSRSLVRRHCVFRALVAGFNGFAYWKWKEIMRMINGVVVSGCRHNETTSCANYGCRVNWLCFEYRFNWRMIDVIKVVF